MIFTSSDAPWEALGFWKVFISLIDGSLENSIFEKQTVCVCVCDYVYVSVYVFMLWLRTAMNESLSGRIKGSWKIQHKF